jgi:uncharacterized protein (DUF58 family)
MKPRAQSLTVRGKVVLVSGGLMGLAAILFGLKELYALALAAIVLVGSARLWVQIQKWDVRVLRHIHPPRVPAGLEARVELTVRNHGPHRSPPVLAADPFDGGRRWARFTVAPLKPGETRRASYRLPTTKRGIFRLGPLELEVCDPFGLARAVQSTTPDTSLTVHPRVDQISARSLSTQADQDIRIPVPVIGRTGTEFFALREYEAGDDLRHVHWPTTARLDDLVIRQPENFWRGRLTVATDLRTGCHDPESLELALSAAASVAVSALRSGLQVRMIGTTGMDSGHGSGQGHAGIILDLLAGAASAPGGALADEFRRHRSREPVVVVTTDLASDADLAAAFRLGGRQSTTVVLFETKATARATQPDGYPAGVSGRYVRVPVGGSFRAAWEGARC